MGAAMTLGSQPIHTQANGAIDARVAAMVPNRGSVNDTTVATWMGIWKR